jgi:hypothetical protein
MNSVSKKPIIGGIILVAIIGVVFVGAQINPDDATPICTNKLQVDAKSCIPNTVWGVTLADPELYECPKKFTTFVPSYMEYDCGSSARTYSHFIDLTSYLTEPELNIDESVYLFRFVASGDSPKVLTFHLFSAEEVSIFDQGCDGPWSGAISDGCGGWRDGPWLKPSSKYFSTSFTLKGTPHDSGDFTSLYYTWDYYGQKEFRLPSDVYVKIIIDPHGNLMGPVSVDLIKLR